MNKKNQYVGGDFQLQAKILKSNSLKELNLDVLGPYCYLLDTGRSAIRAAINFTLSSRKIETAWVPFYSCSTMIKPFIECGLNIRFYGMGSDLNSPVGLPNNISNSIFLFNHYFGKYNRAIINYLENLPDRNNIIIEDAVQTCLSKRVENYGDFVIHSLRKFLPVPDGGILVSKKKLSLEMLPSNERFISTSVISKLIRGQNFSDDWKHLELKEKAESILDQDKGIREISEFSKNILTRLNLNNIQEKRKKNWKFLANEFVSGMLRDNILQPLIKSFNEEEVPLLFPVVAPSSQRDNFLAYLKSRNIFCPVHWTLKKPDDQYLFDDYTLSQSLFSIPIDQRLETEELDYLVKIIRDLGHLEY